MEIDLEQIADKLEFLAAQIRSGKLKPSWANINYSLKFQSRPDENKDGYRMQGGQSFRDKRDAAEFMHRGLGIFQKFDGATGMLTFVFDQTEEIQKEIQALGPVPVKDWILQTHPDFTLPDFMQEIGFVRSEEDHN